MDKEALEMRYLLGKLSDSEAARLEERSFIEDSVFDEIETAEDELVDAYARGSLSSEDRKRFEKKLLNSERLAERVEFAKALSKLGPSKFVSHEPARAPWWKNLFDFSLTPNPALKGAVALGILLVVGIPTLFIWMRLRDERRLNNERAAIEQQKQQLAQQLSDQQSKTNQLAADLQNSKAEEERLQRQLQATKEELTRTNTQPAAPASIFLFASSLRDPANRDVLTVPSTASTIQLKLVVDADDYAAYSARIKSPDGREVLTRAGLKSRRSGRERIIFLQFPSRLLNSGEYLVSLAGLTQSGTSEPVADYPVRVSKK